MDKAKKALKEAIRDKMQGHILEAIGESWAGQYKAMYRELKKQHNSLSSKDLKGRAGASEKSITPKGGGVA